MVATRTPAEAAEKWEKNAGAAAPAYTYGVSHPKKSWSSEARAAESSYEQGVQAAISRKAFGKGVSAAGDAAWSEGATKLGAERYPRGISENKGKYMSGIERVISQLQSITLPKRGPKGDPSNLQRVSAIMEGMRRLKTGSSSPRKSA